MDDPMAGVRQMNDLRLCAEFGAFIGKLRDSI
jgi:hypothetical protein